jgi:hypothetical protein
VRSRVRISTPIVIILKEVVLYICRRISQLTVNYFADLQRVAVYWLGHCLLDDVKNINHVTSNVVPNDQTSA